MQQELAALQRVPQAAFEHEFFQRPGAHLGGIELVLVAALLLGAVHGGVGVAQQLERVVAVAGIEADADAGGDDELASFYLERLRQGVENFLRHLRHVARIRQVLEQHRELVAAETRHGVALAHAGRQPPGGHPQRAVADVMPQRVVDDLETVEIEEQHRQRPVGPARPRERVLQALQEQCAVRQPREHVVVRHELQLLARLAALGDVADDGHEHRRILGGEQLQPHLHRIEAAILTPVHGFEGQGVSLAAPQRGHHGLECFTRMLGLDVHRSQRGQFLRGVAEIAAGSVIDLDEAQAFRLEHVDFVRQVVEDAPETPQHVLAALLFRDVVDRDDARGLAPVLDRAADDLGGEPGPVLAQADRLIRPFIAGQHVFLHQFM